MSMLEDPFSISDQQAFMTLNLLPRTRNIMQIDLFSGYICPFSKHVSCLNFPGIPSKRFKPDSITNLEVARQEKEEEKAIK